MENTKNLLDELQEDIKKALRVRLERDKVAYWNDVLRDVNFYERIGIEPTTGLCGWKIESDEDKNIVDFENFYECKRAL